MQTQRSPTVGNSFLRPIILSDSKGDYLKDQVLYVEDRQIVWWNKRGTHIKIHCTGWRKTLKAK
jgi:hypothetical protein